jgi:hypothetical protein
MEKNSVAFLMENRHRDSMNSLISGKFFHGIQSLAFVHTRRAGWRAAAGHENTAAKKSRGRWEKNEKFKKG